MRASLPDERRKPIEDALRASIERVRLKQRKQPVPPELEATVAQADEEMFSKIREMLGFDQAIAVNAGAAPTPVEVLEFFHALGIELAELWGMSETCGFGACNLTGAVKIGTVGPPSPGVEMKLADDGELLVRGEFVIGQCPPRARRADQEVHDRSGRLAARRRGADADDEAQAQADRGEIRGGDRGDVRVAAERGRLS